LAGRVINNLSGFAALAGGNSRTPTLGLLA
jgi:hypothetical protein